MISTSDGKSFTLSVEENEMMLLYLILGSTHPNEFAELLDLDYSEVARTVHHGDVKAAVERVEGARSDLAKDFNRLQNEFLLSAAKYRLVDDKLLSLQPVWVAEENKEVYDEEVEQ